MARNDAKKELPLSWGEFADLDALRNTELQDGRFTVLIDKGRFDCLLLKKHPLRLFVLLSGAHDTQRGPLPQFDRWSWSDRYPGSVLWISDPTLYLAPEKLRIGWYVGNHEHDWMEAMASLVKMLARRLGIPVNDVICYGSSAGGFASLMLATRLGSATAVAINPQTDIFQYSKRFVNEFLEVAFEGMPAKKLINEMSTRFSAIAAFKSSLKAKCLIVQNTLDVSHFNQHFHPFCDALGCSPTNESEDTGRILTRLYHSESGHGAEPREMVREIVDIAVHLSEKLTDKPGLNVLTSRRFGRDSILSINSEPLQMNSQPAPLPFPSARVLPGPLVPTGSHKISIDRHELDLRCHTLLFTRYFLRGFSPRNRPELSSEQIGAWFAAREPLFRGYTYASVLGQRHTSFTWYILVDEQFSDLVPTEIRTKAADPRVQLVSHDEDGQPIASLAGLDSFVSKQIEHQFEQMRSIGVADPVVTVARLDNDDAISVDFFELLNRLGLIAQREGKNQDTVVSFPHGLQYLRDREFSTYLFNNNHFLASIHSDLKPGGKRVHALSFNHSHVFQEAPCTLIANTNLPMWIEVVHSDNLMNQYKGVMPLRGNQGLEFRFGSAYPIKDPDYKNANFLSAAVDKSYYPDSEIDRAAAARRQLGIAIRDSIAASGAMKPPVFASVYESVLSRVKVERLFEIGIHQGGSIRLWRQLLGAKVRIACMDIKPESCDTVRNMADHVYVGSQIDPELLSHIGADAGPFDIIIDDGSHQNPHMLISFETLFDHVRPGGAYIIEDMFTSYWPRYGGGLRKSGSLIEYLKGLVDLMYSPFVSEKYRKHYLKQLLPKLEHSKVSAAIASIEFFSAGIVVVHKREVS